MSERGIEAGREGSRAWYPARDGDALPDGWDMGAHLRGECPQVERPGVMCGSWSPDPAGRWDAKQHVLPVVY